MKTSPAKSKTTIAIACSFSSIAVFSGYMALGSVPALIFTFGYLGGFFIWLFSFSRVPLRNIILPYSITLCFFIVHKIEERQMGFFPALAKLTGVATPDISSWQAIALYAIALIWLLIPLLIWKKHPLGYYLAWTFFTSMGVTELAHFIFPFFTSKSYSYFPGMWSVILLAPAAWWGMYRLEKQDSESIDQH